jgi:hypothetical protein
MRASTKRFINRSRVDEMLLLVFVLIIVMVFVVAPYVNDKIRRQIYRSNNTKDALTETDWLDRFAPRLKDQYQDQLVHFLKIVSKHLGKTWTVFRPEDLIGPPIFKDLIVDAEPSWNCLSEDLVNTAPEMALLVDQYWDPISDGVYLKELILQIEEIQNRL